MASRPRSLQSRALQLLAQREQSRVELRRKLMVHAMAEAAARIEASGPATAAPPAANLAANLAATSAATSAVNLAASSAASSAAAHEGETPDLPPTPAWRDDPSACATDRVDEVMAWLEAHGFASDERFAESRAHARASRFGNLRIRLELKQHGVTLSANTAEALQHTEWSRALDVWQRRFGQAPETAADAAKQARFMMARGFSTDVVRRVLRSKHAGRGAGNSSGADD